MAEKEVYPLAPAYGYTRSDEEANSDSSEELRRKKRVKCYIYIGVFILFQTGIILLLSLTVMKIKNPKFQVRSATFETFDTQTPNSSFNIRMNAEVGVKNTNFGHYRFDSTTINFFYRGAPIGSALVPKDRAKARKTKKFNVIVDLSSSGLTNNSELENDLNSGVLMISSQASLRGKVELMKVMNKKKSTEMDCTMEINISARELRNINCK